MDPNYQDRQFMASEAVYAQIEQGQVQDVQAALMDAHLQASGDDE
ncbi:hypothetical protein AB0J57_05010 [Streptomyces sp. NPDC049837]